MERRTRASFAAVLVILLLGLLLAASCGEGQEQPAAPTSGSGQGAPATPDAPSLLQERCTRCHNLDRVEQASKTQAEWRVTVERMVNRGAELSPAEIEAVVQYLAEAYPR